MAFSTETNRIMGGLAATQLSSRPRVLESYGRPSRTSAYCGYSYSYGSDSSASTSSSEMSSGGQATASQPHSYCPCRAGPSQWRCRHCYFVFFNRSFDAYHAERTRLRQTYLWNLGELARIHARRVPPPSRSQVRADQDRLYRYYVSRVQAVYDEQCQRQRQVLGRSFLQWTAPPQIYREGA
ncbi:hypothetical protein F4780DRAFT_440344 [Xylariomycetidae sp. FL0641]|nr:hypothetical protein F4780DRAFT_440344 [Xylariomycetidae sp. FL0641]